MRQPKNNQTEFESIKGKIDQLHSQVAGIVEDFTDLKA
jgi:hypothetical protein